MALIKFANFAKAQVAVAPTGTSGLTFSVEAGKGALFPVLGGSEYFYGVFKNEVNNFEIVKIEARSADAMTIAAGTRGFDGTSARTWLAGDVFVGALISAAINEVIGNDALNALGNLTPAADKIAYYTGTETAALADFTAIARSLVAGLTAVAMRTTLDAVGKTGDDTISGTKDFTGVVEHLGASPVVYQGPVDDPTNKMTVNVAEQTAANQLDIPDAPVIRLWNMPPGVMVAYGATAVPSGWLACEGQAVSRTVTYDALFAIIGTTWGVGDGSTTFNLPNMDGRVAMGDGSGRSVGDGGGSDTQTLTTANLASHTHTVGGTTNADIGFFVKSVGGAVAISTGSAGSGTAHNNLQPYRVVRWMISY